MQRLPNGILMMTFTDGSGNSITFNITQELGVNDHDNEQHSCEFIFFETTQSVQGFVPNSLEEVKSALQQGSQTPARRRRRAVGDNSTTTPPPTTNAIANPTFCLQFGQALTFKIDINTENRSLSHYPRYRKNHLMNRNNEFDYGNFRQLHSLVRESNDSLDYFVHVFTQNGTFVFYDNAEPFRETIVNVVGQGATCGDISISPTTEQTLTTLGISSSKVSAC